MKLLHMEAFFYQLSTGFLLIIVPFRYIPNLFRFHPLPSALRPPPDKVYLEEIRYVTWSVSRFIPWRNKCLVKSLAAKKMLNRRGISSQLSLGVQKDEKLGTMAHAWLKAGDFEVVEKEGGYSELYIF